MSLISFRVVGQSVSMQKVQAGHDPPCFYQDTVTVMMEGDSWMLLSSNAPNIHVAMATEGDGLT